MFSIAPLTWGEWKGVLIISFPVIIIDEILKLLSRMRATSSSGSTLAKKRQ